MKLIKLLIISIGVLSMTVNASTLSQDEAQIRSNINSYAALADQAAFEYLGRLFAPEVSLDYTSLFGGEVQQINREELMMQWAGFLPGFDTTFHQISNHRVTVNDNSANARVDFTASHWLGSDGFWQISGEYVFTLQRVQNNWEISSVQLISKQETGSREVLAKAPEQANAKLIKRNQARVSFQ
ncbi:nuclear transport factor 2 family protein [Agarivorans sp. JK6]|uniref:nuclear transport factor 2 family protein n=1 Tax=Agarivorans sp. JK6 TaxID=2997426 RepID=UPI0038738095